jgi:hypothetical protein
MPEPIFIYQAIARVTELGRVNHTAAIPALKINSLISKD